MATVFSTKGIVLRTVKYGETSIIASIYTELFGLQSYLVNGVRSAGKKGPGRASLFQPGALLDMVVYHNDLKNLQRIKEFKWGYLYQHIFSSIFKNAVALFMVELLTKTIKQPEQNTDLFYFIEDAFMHLDASSPDVAGNFPLFFSLHLATLYGFRLSDEYSANNCYLDLQEGEFVPEQPVHPYFLGEPYSAITSQLLKTQQPQELSGIPLNQETRRVLMTAYQQFYALHIADFGVMKTLPVLQEVLR
ncbi:MAG TPA: DNA repair protein RecO [Chitinophagaceae bacterium]|nr:DNA repair protein RecO [Chitinophagaceae bacterium]